MAAAEPRNQLGVIRPPAHQPLKVAVGRLDAGARDEPGRPSMDAAHVPEQVAELPLGTRRHRRGQIDGRGDRGEALAVPRSCSMCSWTSTCRSRAITPRRSRVLLDLAASGLELIGLHLSRASRRLDLRAHVRDGNDVRPTSPLSGTRPAPSDRSAHAGRRVTCDRSHDGAAGRRSDQEPAADRREREQRDHEAARESDAGSERAAGTGRRFVLLDDLRLGPFRSITAASKASMSPASVCRSLMNS